MKTAYMNIENAAENNLRNVSLRIPHYKLIAVTGVSGSGKSSLVQDVISREGQRLFYEYFLSGYQSGKKPPAPKAAKLEGLFPVISVDQNHVVRNPRSTVGTLTETHDYLRLLFARLGVCGSEGVTASRSLFSYNHPLGQCPACKGLGVQDRIDPSLIVGDASKSVREGALVLTTPNNYIIYSQVTMDVLNQVCNAEGFSVDIPWNELTEEQKNIIWYGSEKIKILFGKHTLESRLKWSGITAKPREEGFYKGILPVMEEILKRDRNPNILRFARSFTCSECGGRRLHPEALSFTLWNHGIADYSQMTIGELHSFFERLPLNEKEVPVAGPVCEALLNRTRVLRELGLGHLTLFRESTTLSGGESSRIRLSNQLATGMRNVLYLLDEPSAGLHLSEQGKLLGILNELVRNGNTVIAVEHDEATMRAADWICDIGPGPGEKGGEIVFHGASEDFFSNPPENSITAKYLFAAKKSPEKKETPQIFFTFQHVNRNNLKNIDVRIATGSFNVITGVSGSGKSSLAGEIIERTRANLKSDVIPFRKVIHFDQSPIGRTPNSNPATYTGLSDLIRDLMASLEESKKKNFKKGQFSFVVKGGRCEACGGAGVQETGMHFLGNIEVICDTCEGKRFTEETLSVQYKGKNIYDILELTVEEADAFFEGNKKITAITRLLLELGLGYLKLGQPSTTLSGGEAQRVKLAYELSRSATGHTLYVLDEPTTGLHMADTEILLKALRQLTKRGHTLLCIEHDPGFILQADWVIDLGPGSGADGGRVMVECTPCQLPDTAESVTALSLRKYLHDPGEEHSAKSNREMPDSPPLFLKNITTNKLRHADVSVEPYAITAVCGPSGSGKSSLLFDTIFSECQRRFMDGMSSYIRQFIGKTGNASLESSHGLMPAIALRKRKASHNPRSTLGTYTGIYDLYRLLYSRVARKENGLKADHSSRFSFNQEEGACPACKGLGTLTVCDPERLVTYPEKPLTAGAMDGTKTGRFYGDPFGQYVAALLAAGKKYQADFSKPWTALSEKEKSLAMHGCGDEIFDVEWNFKRGNHEGSHRMTAPWPGFCGHVEEEYGRKHADHRGESMLPLMKQIPCSECGGARLKPEMQTYRISGTSIHNLCCMENVEAVEWFRQGVLTGLTDTMDISVAQGISKEILPRLQALNRAGLGYLSMDRRLTTLSGGEFQRLELAGISMSSLSGILCLIDEPSFGLHPEDAGRMADIIRTLHQQGNTILLSDHADSMLSLASHVIELGPGAGEQGGNIVYQGEVSAVRNRISEIRNGVIPLPAHTSAGISVKNAYVNNLKNISVDIPSGCLALITGASGSGKSTLLAEVIHKSMTLDKASGCESFHVFNRPSGLVYVEQEIPAVSSRSVPAGFTGLSDLLRKVFAGAEQARKLGFTQSHFSFHTKDGQCTSCGGNGIQTISLDFWSDAEILCEECGGKRFRSEVLQVETGGVNIADVYALTFDSFTAWAENHFSANDYKKIRGLLSLINKSGLGYLTLGQRMNTLSTGELQRLKLATALASAGDQPAWILLDEPTGGLHPSDTRKVLFLFEDLLKAGHSLLCVSHDPMLMKAAGWHATLGPGGGRFGGELMNH